MALPLTRGGTSVLSVEEMYRAERLVVEQGVSSLQLMENACHAVVSQVIRRWSPRPILVICGPGNNGGDGLGVAIFLRKLRWPIQVALLGPKKQYKDDARTMVERWGQSFVPFETDQLEKTTLVVDALFGAGLNRPVRGRARSMLEGAVERELEILSIDMPSGIDGNTGQVIGFAVAASVTVTFFRPKVGHMLLPGRELSGELVVSDIGIPKDVIATINPKQCVNGPDLWLKKWPQLSSDTHKYQRGHALVLGGNANSTGAGRLSAEAALRVGAGLVSVGAPQDALAVYGAQLTAVMICVLEDATDLQRLLHDKQFNAVLVGPGTGVNDQTKENVLMLLSKKKACVLDADALTCFSDSPDILFKQIQGNCVITPHDGEYKRLFRFKGDRLVRARSAAKLSGSVVLLKGGDCVVAAPDGRAAFLTNATPNLATAGSGDVLAGLVLGLLAQACEPYIAACMASWIHGEIGRRIGSGLVSEDLHHEIPEILGELRFLRSLLGN